MPAGVASRASQPVMVYRPRRWTWLALEYGYQEWSRRHGDLRRRTAWRRRAAIGHWWRRCLESDGLCQAWRAVCQKQESGYAGRLRQMLDARQNDPKAGHA